MKVFSTGQVAKICKVAPRTVSKWFDSGRLKGFRIPGSQDRRIPREYLIKFLKEHGMPLGDLENDTVAKVVIVSQDTTLSESVKNELLAQESFKACSATSSFETGVAIETMNPDCIIIDFDIDWGAADLSKRIREHTDYGTVILIGLVSDTRHPITNDHSIINETFKKPFDTKLLAARLCTLIGVKKELV